MSRTYFGLIGLIIAFVLNQSEKASLASFHIRQSVGLQIVLFLCYMVVLVLGFIPGVRYITFILLPLLGLGGLVLWIFSLIAAIGSEMKPMPVIGNETQARLGGIRQ